MVSNSYAQSQTASIVAGTKEKERKKINSSALQTLKSFQHSRKTKPACPASVKYHEAEDSGEHTRISQEAMDVCERQSEPRE